MNSARKRDLGLIALILLMVASALIGVSVANSDSGGVVAPYDTTTGNTYGWYLLEGDDAYVICPTRLHTIKLANNAVHLLCDE